MSGTDMTQKKAQVVLYTRPDCHLCELAKEQVLAADCSDQFELQEINIESDPALVERYGLLIPVIAINGKEAFRFRITSHEFKSAVMASLH